jgi:hypothetical protein
LVFYENDTLLEKVDEAIGSVLAPKLFGWPGVGVTDRAEKQRPSGWRSGMNAQIADS